MNKVFNETLNLDTDKDYQQNYTCRQTNRKHIWGYIKILKLSLLNGMDSTARKMKFSIKDFFSKCD